MPTSRHDKAPLPLLDLPVQWPAELVQLPLPQEGGEFWDALELRVTALELQERGVQLTPIETSRGRGLRAALGYRGVRCLWTSYVAEGPHYHMLAVDVASAVERKEPPDALVGDLVATLNLPMTSKCWQTSLDALFHLRADERFARDVLGIESLTRQA